MASHGIGILSAEMSIRGLCGKPQCLPVIFPSFFYWHECLLWKRPAGKHRYEVLPTDVASILFLVQAALVILIESVFPAVQFGSTIAP